MNPVYSYTYQFNLLSVIYFTATWY